MKPFASWRRWPVTTRVSRNFSAWWKLAPPMARSSGRTRPSRSARCISQRRVMERIGIEPVTSWLRLRISLARDLLGVLLLLPDSEVVRMPLDDPLDPRLLVPGGDGEVGRYGPDRLVLVQSQRDLLSAG